jgi:hypothetical protein
VIGAKILAPGTGGVGVGWHTVRFAEGGSQVTVEDDPDEEPLVGVPVPLKTMKAPTPASTMTTTRMIAPIIGDIPPLFFGVDAAGGINSSVGDLGAVGGFGPLFVALVAMFHSWIS